VIDLLINAIPAPVWAALAGMLGIAAAWLTGRRSGSVAAKTKAAIKAVDDLQKAKDARDEVDSISGDDVSKRLREWNRK
jgi:hypothetical protein